MFDINLGFMKEILNNIYIIIVKFLVRLLVNFYC